MKAVFSSISSRRAWWLAALILLVPGLMAAAKEPPASVASEISVTLVEIPVEVAARNGEPVTGLTAADFEVVEGGRPLPIVAFETIHLGAPEKPGTPPSLAARRHLLLLFDFALSEPQRLAQGVAAAREMVATGLDPRDLVAVGIYLPKGELQLLLSFTTDRAAAGRTLGALEGLLKGEASAKGAEESDPLRLTGLGARSLLNQVFQVDERNFARDALASLGGGGVGGGSAVSRESLREGFLQRNVLHHSSVLHEPHVLERRRGHVLAMSDAMGGLADALRPVTGRKYLALFSEGFPMSIAYSSGGYQSPSGGGSFMLDKLGKTMAELKRAGWVLHAVNLGGARPGARSADGLFFLANETGGTVVEGTNQLAQGLDGALRRSAHGYLLTVEADVPLDGAYHKVDVRLRDSRRAKVNHRGGYYAPLPFTRQKDVQRLAEAAALVGGGDERDDLGIEVAAVPLRAGAESSTVAVLVEVPGAPLLAPGTPRVGLEVFGYALDEKGNSSDFFAQAIDLDRAKIGDRLAQGGVRVLGKLDLPTGQHRLRVMVRDRANGRLSLLSVPLSLAAGAVGPRARIDALFLPPTDDPWLLVRPAEASFDIHGRAVLPAARGALPAAGEAQLLLLGHGFTGKGAWVRGRILTAEGKPAAGGALDLLTVSPGEAGEPDLMLGRLRAGSLPPGSYLLELRIGGEDGAVHAVTARPFLVATPGS